MLAEQQLRGPLPDPQLGRLGCPEKRAPCVDLAEVELDPLPLQLVRKMEQQRRLPVVVLGRRAQQR